MTQYDIQHAGKRAMIRSLAITGIVARAAKAAGVARCTHYEWLKSDQAYAKAVEDAMVEAVDALETEAIRRAVAGVSEPFMHGGEIIRDEQGRPLLRHKYSDMLLIFLFEGGSAREVR